MERLTTRNIAGVAVYKYSFECERCGEEIWRLPDYGNGSPTDKLASYEDAEEQGIYGKWIPVSERLPEEPKENEIFDNKPLELYLVSIKGDPYPFRAFWNGKFFTNGWQKCEVTAWMPLPETYRESGV